MPYYPYALFYWFSTSIWLYNFIFALKRNIIILACQYQYRKRLQPKGWAIEFGFRPFFWHQHIDRVHGLQGRSLREEGCTCCHHRGPCPSVLWKVNDVGRRSCSNTHFGTKRRHHMSTMHPPDILCHSPLLSMSWTTYGGI